MCIRDRVFNVFLQILDDGRLTDGKGRTVNFTNTILIMTSNLGSQYKEEEKVLEEVRHFFKPEFINRLDSIIVYNGLNEEIMKQIVDMQLSEVSKRLLDHGLTLEITDSARAHLNAVGFDDMYGARPLKRVINELIIDEIALQILEEKIASGDHVVVDALDGRIVLQRKKVN